jgi:NhaA family Na+:H+ antiporter
LEISGGIILLASSIVAIFAANSGLRDYYNEIINFKIMLPGFGKLILFWINDGLMALFFFLVSLEIKREMLYGELKSIKKPALPLAAAIGGMIIPMLIYLAFNAGGKGSHGWGIPMATDIAFSLSILSLLGKRVPVMLKIFLTALAIIDDIGAIIVIAFFYTSDLSVISLLVSWVLAGVLYLMNKSGYKKAYIYIITGIFLWVAILNSGIHPTVAGVILAFAIPADRNEDKSLLHKMEDKLHPYVTYFIMPLFAFANSGVIIGAAYFTHLFNPISLGIILGLVLGKQIGIILFSYLAVKLKFAELPHGINWRQIYGIGWLGGIGFTMSLFIGGLAFESSGLLLNEARIGIFTASLIAGIFGYLMLRVFGGKKNI